MFYLIQHQYTEEGGVPAITPPVEFKTLDEAKTRWHSNMAYNMDKSTPVIASLNIIYEGNGIIHLTDFWQRETETTK